MLKRFETFDFQEDWEDDEPKDPRKIIVFASGNNFYFGHIFFDKLYDGYRVNVCHFDGNQIHNCHDYNMNVIEPIDIVLLKKQENIIICNGDGCSEKIRVSDLETVCDVYLIGYNNITELKKNPEKWI